MYHAYHEYVNWVFYVWDSCADFIVVYWFFEFFQKVALKPALYAIIILSRISPIDVIIQSYMKPNTNGIEMEVTPVLL